MRRSRNRDFWRGARPLFIPRGGRPLPYQKKLLQATNEYFCAGAVWERIDGLWKCTEAAPIIGWMRGMSPPAAKLELARRGCQWEWI
jgi:hypothetical protein